MKFIFKFIFLTWLLSISYSAGCQTKENIKRMHLEITNELTHEKTYSNKKTEEEKEHTIYNYPISLDKIIFVVFTTSDGHGCHSCPSVASFFLYKKINKEWCVINKEIHTNYLGSFGEALSKDQIKLKLLNEHIFIIINDGSMYQGQSQGNTNIHYFKENYFSLYDFTNSQYDDIEKKSDWKASYQLKLNKNNIPKLTIVSKGIKDGKPYNKTKTHLFLTE